MLEVAKTVTVEILEQDPDLKMAANLPISNFLHQQKGKTAWSKIS